MNTNQLLDALAKKQGLTTDYQIKKFLGVSSGRIANYRSGRNFLDELIAVRIADELELDRGQVLAWIAAERAERREMPEVAKAWQRVAKRAAVGLVAAIGLQASSPPTAAIAAPSPTAGTSESLCIMSNRRRRWLDVLEAVFGRLPMLAL